MHGEGWQGSKCLRSQDGKWAEHPCLGITRASQEIFTVARGVLSGMLARGLTWTYPVHGGNATIVLPFKIPGIGSRSHWGTILSSVLVNNRPTFYLNIFKFFFPLHFKIWINNFLKSPQGWPGLGLTVPQLLEIPVVHLNFNVSIICSSV